MSDDSWPRVGYPLLPEVLREAWSSELLPPVVSRRLRLDELRLGDLGSSVWTRFSPYVRSNAAAVGLLANHLVAVVTSRLYHKGIGGPMLLSSPLLRSRWNPDVRAADLPFSTRTLNVLRRSGLAEDPTLLSELSVEDFLGLRGAGAKTLLDFSTVAEVHAGTGLPVGAEPDRASILAEIEAELGEFPLEDIDASDPRLAGVGLPPLGGNLRDVLEEALRPDSASGVPAARGSLGLIQGVRHRLAELRDEPLDVALRHAIERVGGSHGDALLLRLGWDGAGGATLQEAADSIKRTRERVRQLETRARKRCRAIRYMPALDRAIDVLSKGALRFEDEADKLLYSEGISTLPFLPHGVTTAAVWFGRSIEFRVGDAPESVELKSDSDLHALRRALRSLTDLNHVSSVAELQARAAEIGAADVSSRRVHGFLDRAGVAWLDAGREWFWDGSESRYVNFARKILAAAGRPVTIGSLREGVFRHHRTRYSSVPREAFEGLCRAAGFRVESGAVSSREELDEKSVLSPNQQLLVDVLRRNENVMWGPDLREGCVAGGMNPSSYFVYVTYSPLVERLAPVVYALRGAPVDPALVIERSGRTTTRQDVLQDHGWTKDGGIWVGYRISQNVLYSGVVGIPSAVQGLVAEAHFELITLDGTPIGKLSWNENGSAWGLTPFINRRGVDVGDYLVVALDTQLGVAVVQAGSPDLLLTFQEGDGRGPKAVLEEVTAPRLADD